jgi:hypothetical protein
MAAAPIENKSDCDQRGATSNNLNCEEGTTRAIGRWHHCHDQCEKRRQKTRPRIVQIIGSLLGGLSIFVKGDLLCRMLEADRRQVSIVRLAPGTLSLVVAPMAQQHRLDLQAHPLPRGASIFSRASQISDCFVPLIGNDDDEFDDPYSTRRFVWGTKRCT